MQEGAGICQLATAVQPTIVHDFYRFKLPVVVCTTTHIASYVATYVQRQKEYNCHRALIISQ